MAGLEGNLAKGELVVIGCRIRWARLFFSSSNAAAAAKAGSAVSMHPWTVAITNSSSSSWASGTSVTWSQSGA